MAATIYGAEELFMPRAMRVVPPRGPQAITLNYLVLTNVPVQTSIKITAPSFHINTEVAEITVSMANNTARLNLRPVFFVLQALLGSS